MDTTLLDLALAVARRPPGASGSSLGPAELGCMRALVERGDAWELSPEQRWHWLSLGLRTVRPSAFFSALRRSGGLRLLWPELDALFGVPQLSDAQEPIDVGEHQLRVLDAMAGRDAPDWACFAALAHKLGKADTPHEVQPSHYKHEQRGLAALESMRRRVAVPDEALELAQLVVAECDRVHRVSVHRAGAITDLLERVRAAERPGRFGWLLTICACDYGAYEGHDAHDYPKAAHLLKALAAYSSTLVDGLSADGAREARADSVARALGSFAYRRSAEEPLRRQRAAS